MTNVEMFEYVKKEFSKRGFISDPRGEHYYRSLYNPVTKINVHIGNIGSSSVGINVVDMVNDGMTWGEGYKNIGGIRIRFNFKNKTFEKFFETTYTNRVKKIMSFLEN